jgi:diguanylate cyclase (GGDEF)-like protein
VRAATRRVDVLVRRGGEEFVLLMPATTMAQAKVIAERVRRHASEEPIVVESARVTQTVSIGVATWDGRQSSAALQRRADDAMYDAKQRGRNRVEAAPERKPRALKGTSGRKPGGKTKARTSGKTRSARP